jgi:hypothetical protein
MSNEKIEAFWENATADDVARVMAGETVEARFRDDEHSEYTAGLLAGWTKGDPSWMSREQAGSQSYFVTCQVYREPSWYANKPDPGPGFRLLEKFPDEEPKPGDECFGVSGAWGPSCQTKAGGHQVFGMWYRRRIEPVGPKFAVGQMVRLVGPKVKPARNWTAAMDEHIEQVYTVISVQRYPSHPSGTADFYSVKGVVEWAFREDYLEPVEPEPKHYVLRVGDSVETPSGHRIEIVSRGETQRTYALTAGGKVTLPNGQTITITAKGFEVAQ